MECRFWRPGTSPPASEMSLNMCLNFRSMRALIASAFRSCAGDADLGLAAPQTLCLRTTCLGEAGWPSSSSWRTFVIAMRSGWRCPRVRPRILEPPLSEPPWRTCRSPRAEFGLRSLASRSSCRSRVRTSCECGELLAGQEATGAAGKSAPVVSVAMRGGSAGPAVGGATATPALPAAPVPAAAPGCGARPRASRTATRGRAPAA
mmetsp:Transcript_82591/g.257864  ORF Transcript_82591/g.257864 Transcript_82591/m.257864 type:complete len:205 (-) Transcript_82591:426-1040(-)